MNARSMMLARTSRLWVVVLWALVPCCSGIRDGATGDGGRGPTGSARSALNVGRLTLSGGVIISVQTRAMSDELSGTYSQNLLRVVFDSEHDGGSLIHIASASGTGVLTFGPAKAYKALVFSSPALVVGDYELHTGGNATGAANDGVYAGGAYTGGAVCAQFTVSDTTTQVGGCGKGGQSPRPEWHGSPRRE